MAEFLHSSNPPSFSPKLVPPVKTLVDESSPTAPIRSLVTNSLSLSSPIRGIQAYPKKQSLILVPIPNGSSDKTLIEPSSTSPVKIDSKDSQILPADDDNTNNNDDESLQMVVSTSSDAYPCNRRPRRFIDDLNEYEPKIESSNPVPFSWSYPKPEPTGVGAGLDNSGNTCFIASVLQCFTHTVSLLESLRAYKHQIPCNCGSERFCVMQELQNHIELALRSSGYNLRIDRFRDNINHFSPDFQISNQEDAHEFLQSFLDKLERCCLDHSNKVDSVSSQDNNIVDHVFGGRLVSRLHCCNCDSFSDTFEPSVGWSLEIEDVESLWSALESFTSIEKLEDQLTCDNCEEKVSKEKQLKLDKLPPVATFHLKRFKNDGLFMEKIFKHVDFPLELDLLPYMSGNQDPEVSTKYYLYAMVEHLGSGVSFGHYSAYVRSAPETWHKFDDAKVTRVTEECVLSRNAYLLFYAREGTPWFSYTFEELKRLYEANPLPFSPKSVLETTTCREESVSDHSNENLGNFNKASVGVSVPGLNYSDFRCDEPQEEVFHSAESSSDESSMNDVFESPEAYEPEKPFGKISPQRKPEKPFGETSQQRVPESCTAGDRATTNDDANVSVLKAQQQDSSPKRKANEGVILGDTHRPKLKIPKLNLLKKKQGRFQIQRDHLRIKKKEEETRGTRIRLNVASAFAADPKQTEFAHSYLKRQPTARARMLAAALNQQ